MAFRNTPFFKLSLMTIILFIFVVILRYALPAYMVSDALLFIVPFFYLITVAFRVITLRVEKRDNKQSKMFVLVASAIKLGIYLMILLVYGLLNREDVVPFFISFLIFYIIYSYADVRHTVTGSSLRR